MVVEFWWFIDLIRRFLFDPTGRQLVEWSLCGWEIFQVSFVVRCKITLRTWGSILEFASSECLCSHASMNSMKENWNCGWICVDGVRGTGLGQSASNQYCSPVERPIQNSDLDAPALRGLLILVLIVVEQGLRFSRSCSRALQAMKPLHSQSSWPVLPIYLYGFPSCSTNKPSPWLLLCTMLSKSIISSCFLVGSSPYVVSGIPDQ